MVGNLAAIAILFIITVLFIIFSLSQIFQGRTHSARIQKDGGSVMLSQFLMEFAYWILKPIAQICVNWKISPNTISFLCLILGLIAAIFISIGDFAMAGVVSACSALMDALDGMVARQSNIASDSGEVLDAAIDRYSEMFFCFGLFTIAMTLSGCC